MVDVGGKEITEREAAAGGRLAMSGPCFEALRDGSGPKGEALQTARVAGIMAAKRTPLLVPYCHAINASFIAVEFSFHEPCVGEERYEIEVVCTVRARAQTGVEMEALTGAATALLTLYDMGKAVDKAMVVRDLRVYSKTGGKSGPLTFVC